MKPRRGRTTHLLLVLVGLAAMFASACSDSSSTANPTTTLATAPTSTTGSGSKSAATVSAVPKVGDCLEPMTPELAAGFQLPTIVDCSAPHGGEVVTVAKLSDDPKAAYPAMGRSLVGADAEATKCLGGTNAAGDFSDFVGDNALDVTAADKTATGITQAWRVSGLDVATYVPGTAAWSAGERWLVCAAVLNNTIEQPSQYDGTAKGGRAKPGALTAELAWCKKQESSTSTDFSAVPCTQPHNYEQLANFVAGSNDATFPGADALDQMGKQLCTAFDSTATDGKSDSLTEGFALSWLAPTESAWAQGDRTVRCYATTTTGLSTGTIGSGTAEKSP